MGVEDLRYLKQYGVDVESLFRENESPQPKPIITKAKGNWHPRLTKAEREIGDPPGRQRHTPSSLAVELTIRDYEG